jgi:hypothetical protein
MSYKPEVFDYGGYGVNCKITHMDTGDKDIAWVRGNSFVIVNNDKGAFLMGQTPVDLVSINGIGEIRWRVWERDITSAQEYEAKDELKDDWDCAMHLRAFRWLGLKLRNA